MILKKSVRIGILLPILFVFALLSLQVTGVNFAVADEHTTGGSNTTGGTGGPVTGGQNPGPPREGDPSCPGGTGNCLINPINAGSIEELILKIIDVILVFLIPIIVLYIMYAGFLFVTARGEPAKIEKARTALLWAIVGGVIVLSARAIITVIEGTITPIITG